MQPFRYCAEWIVARPKDITVERFVGWRRAGKRRLFEPFALLRMGEHTVALDGKSAVWDFIDAVQPNMPRGVVNQGMKGEFIHEQPFAQDLQDFIAESEAHVVVFQCAIVNIAEPNSTSLYRGYCARHIKAQEKSHTILTPPKSWGQSISLRLPMRTREGIKWLPSLVVGDYPFIIVAQSLSQSGSLDLESNVLVSSLICGLGMSADMRAGRSLMRTDPATIISTIAERHHALCDGDFAPAPCSDSWLDDRAGMLFAEIEDIEIMRAERLFFSTP